LVCQLFSDVVPKTCQNFKGLCAGTKVDGGFGTLTYKDSVFHRIQPRGWVQGGDIVDGAGDGGRSIFGDTFEDENFAILHDRRGRLGMANNGLHSNASQFFISFSALEWMNTKYVAFGYVCLTRFAMDLDFYGFDCLFHALGAFEKW
ncbi:uncharacterized protein MONBRDRAFT_14262, partial [Monosiga brevicollis MX1]